MTGERPLGAVVHLTCLYEAACHDCGWGAEPVEDAVMADQLANLHNLEAHPELV